ncbi:MAG: DUF4870 domain-containing protein [Acetanaerobacterium sp.]
MTEEQNVNATTDEPTAQSAAPEYDPQDIEKNKTVAGLAYILFFLPFIACPESKFGRFHANQGLVLLITNVAGWIVLSVISTIITLIIPLLGLFLFPVLGFVFGVLILVLVIMGLVNGLGGKAAPLPVIGKIKILK